MALSNVSLAHTFFQWMTSHNSIIIEVNKLIEGIFRTTGNVTITNAGAPGTVSLNVANGLIKGDGGLVSNIRNSSIIGTFSNALIQNNGITIIVSGLEAGGTANLGGTWRANVNLSTSVANTQTTLAAAASVVNTVHGLALTASSQAGGAHGTANNANTTAGAAFGQANLARGDANTASASTGAAFNQANNARTDANTKFTRLQVLNVDSGFSWSNSSLFLAAASNTGNAIRIVAGGKANVAIDAGNNAIRIGTFGHGKKKLWVPAVAMYGRTSNGAASGTAETTTNKNIIKTLDFDSSSQEFAQFSVAMPKAWNLGTVSFVPLWSHANTQTNFGVVWALQGVAIGDADNFDAAFGSEVTSGDTGTANNRLYRGPESSAMTIAGTPAAEDMVLFQIKRNPGDASDTMAIDARLHGIELFITTKDLTED